MKHRYTRLASLATALLVFASHGTAAADPPGWRLAWQDDFDQFDAATWTKVDTNVPTNNSRQDYLPEQVTVENGSLVITAEDEPSRGLPYRSGQVISKSEQRLGRWEVRAKLPTSRGMWPAIWLLPQVDRYLWPSGGEIDILENRGDQPNLTSSAFHYGSRTPYLHQFVYDEQQTAVGDSLANYHDSFHTYAVDWTDNYLRFYVDGVNHYTVYDEDVGGFLSQNTAPMQLVINNAIGGAFLDDPDASTVWPQRMEIDWVRVYEPAPESFVATFTNGDFEQGQGLLSGWSVFGNDLRDNPNVRLASEATAGGEHSLKLFGTFAPGVTSYSGVAQGISVAEGAEVRAAASAFIKSNDSIAGTDNSVQLKIEFYSEFGAKYGSAKMLGEESLEIATANTVEDAWHAHELVRTAPAGAVEARLSLVFTQPGQGAGAVHIDDVAFTAVAPAAAQGDFNGDGTVDLADYTTWRDALGQTGVVLPADGNGDGQVDTTDYEVWRSNYGQASTNASVAAPEPGTGVGLMATFITLISQRQFVHGAR